MPARPFISYAREDQPAAVRLYADLRAAGVRPWLDLAELLPGQEWQPAIRKAIREASHVIVLISAHSVGKTGFVQHETREAIDLADSRPPDTIYVIPVRLDATLPKYEKLQRLQWVELFPDYKRGLTALLRALSDNESITPLMDQPRRNVASRKRLRSLRRTATAMHRSSYWLAHAVSLNCLLPAALELERRLAKAGIPIRLEFGAHADARSPVYNVVTVGRHVTMTCIRHLMEILPEDEEWYIHVSDERGENEFVVIGAYGYGGQFVARVTNELRAALAQSNFTTSALREWIWAEETTLGADHPVRGQE